MPKKVTLVSLAILFVFCFGIVSAQAADWAEYDAKMKDLNQQMVQIRDEYKQTQRDIDKAYALKQKEIDPRDREAKRLLFDKKSQEKKEAKQAYKEAHNDLKAQVKQLKRDYRGIVSTKKGSKPKPTGNIFN